MMQRLVITVCLALAITACGFHLRGSKALPEHWQPLLLQSLSPNSDLLQQVKRELELRGVNFTDELEKARLKLDIQSLREEQRTLSLDSEARVNKYTLTLHAQIALATADGTALGSHQDLQVRRILTNDPDNPVGSSSEANLVRQEMTAALAQRIADQLLLWTAHLDSEI